MKFTTNIPAYIPASMNASNSTPAIVFSSGYFDTKISVDRKQIIHRHIRSIVDFLCQPSGYISHPDAVFNFIRAVQLLLGHSRLESTIRYLGIEVDDALEIAEQIEI